MNVLPDLILGLQEAGADLLEIGIPFSDPIADGPVIQHTSNIALKNGATPAKIFQVLKEIKNDISIPLYVMSYYNPLYYGNLEFNLTAIKEAGADGVIIPDLPVEEYEVSLHNLFVQLELDNMFLYSAATSRGKMETMCRLSHGFLYLLSGSIITGQDIQGIHLPPYYSELQLKERTLVGFGIKNNQRFRQAVAHARGAIVGTAFLEWITRNGTDKNSLKQFISYIKGE